MHDIPVKGYYDSNNDQTVVFIVCCIVAFDRIWRARRVSRIGLGFEQITPIVFTRTFSNYCVHH